MFEFLIKFLVKNIGYKLVRIYILKFFYRFIEGNITKHS